MDRDYLLIGEVSRPQGVRGDVKIRPITNDPERFRSMTWVWMREQDAYVRREIAVRSVADDAVFAHVEGVDTREAAETLRGAGLYVDREHAVPLGEDENFIVDLIGCEAVDESGRVYGRIRDVLQPGGNDVYVVAARGGEILIPALKSVVLRVDVAAKRVLLDARRLQETAVFPDSEGIR